MPDHGRPRQHVASPADGKWSFQTASDTIRVNPTGAGIPATTIHVPHYSFIIIGETPTAYVTFAHMALEGTRSVIADLGDPNQGIVGLEMNNVDIRHWRTYAYQLHSDTDVNIHDSTLEYGARGVSFGLTGSFAFRTFAMHNGTYANNIIRHIGAGGVTKAGGGAGWECSWCDAPWDSLIHTQFSVLGAAIQVKQTTTFLVDGNTISDISGVAIGNDVSRFMTVSDNTVTAGRRIRGMKKEDIRRIAMRQLDRFGIGHLNHRSARNISGGEAQRTSLARAFALQPEVLLLDEPFASLDPPTRESLIEELEGILRPDPNDHALCHSRSAGGAEALRSDCRDEQWEDSPDRLS